MKISRKTKTVKLFIDLFEREKNALSVIELISIFKKQMNKTTVYRILSRLENAGFLHSFVDKNGLKRFAKGDQRNTSSNNSAKHPHFLCEDCGISTCLPIKIATPSIPNYIINTTEQLYLGQCIDCQP